MNRRSVIRCILGLAAAPKILAEMDFSPLVENSVFDITKINKRIKEVEGFAGVIPTILNGGYQIESYGDLTPQQFQTTWNEFQLAYFDDILQKRIES